MIALTAQESTFDWVTKSGYRNVRLAQVFVLHADDETRFIVFALKRRV
jgi:hypothetical protein